MKAPPCKGCPKNPCGVGHDTCKEYKAWAAEVRKANDAERKDCAWQAYRNAMFKKAQK